MSSISSVVSESSSDELVLQKKPKRQKPKWQAHVSEGWLRKVTQTRKYGMVLNGKQFCKSWTLSDSIRDLIQNATDSMYAVHRKHHKCKKPRVVIDSPPHSWDESTKIVTKIYLECEKGGRTESPVGYLLWTPQDDNHNSKGPVITIINLGAKFTPNALTVGVSNKAEGAAGGHGEGLKAAITVAIRAKSLFEIFQAGVAIKFEESVSSVLYKVSSPIHKTLEFKHLTKEVTKKLGVSVQNDVIIHFGNTPNLTFEDYQESLERFLFLTHRHSASSEIADFPIVNRKETKSGRAILLGEEFAGKVYAVGIYFKTIQRCQRLYGVDFIKEDALSRDRNEISDRSYCIAMAKVLSEVLEEDPLFANVLLEEFKEAKLNPEVIDHLELLPNFASSQAKRNMVEAYKRNPENSDVKYIVTGVSLEQLTNNALVPQWCDVLACRVVDPILFALICEGFPSIETIKHETTAKLLACPVFEKGSRDLRNWLKQKREFFDPGIVRTMSHMEVKKTDDMLDVPFYVIENGNKLIFSERALKLKRTDPRKFLDIANNALKEFVPQSLPVVEESSKAESSSSSIGDVFSTPKHPNTSRKFKTDFHVPHKIGKNWKIPDDDEEQIAKLEKGLTDSISFGGYSIRCTQAAKDQWSSLIAH